MAVSLIDRQRMSGWGFMKTALAFLCPTGSKTLSLILHLVRRLITSWASAAEIAESTQRDKCAGSICRLVAPH